MRPQSNQIQFGAVQHFAFVSSQGQHLDYLAWIQSLEDIDIDHEKHIASYGRQGNYTWIEIKWIKSLFGVLKDGGIKLIVTDINLFD